MQKAARSLQLDCSIRPLFIHVGYPASTRQDKPQTAFPSKQPLNPKVSRSRPFCTVRPVHAPLDESIVNGCSLPDLSPTCFRFGTMWYHHPPKDQIRNRSHQNGFLKMNATNSRAGHFNQDLVLTSFPQTDLKEHACDIDNDTN